MDAAATEGAGRASAARDGAGRDDPTEAGAEPASEADLLDELGDEIARLAAHVHAGMRRYLELVAEFDRRRGWEPSGHTSCARWLAFRTGHDLGTAREHVRVARALDDLPATGEAMARGGLSFSQVRALTRVATPETEADLLPLAEGCPTATLERMVRAWKKGSRHDEAVRERARHRDRRLSVFPDDDGMYVVTGRLTPEVGALLQRAVEAAEDALYRAEASGSEAADRDPADVSAEPSPPGEGPTDVSAETCSPSTDGSAEPRSPSRARRAARRRRADAIGLLAERALAAGFGGGDAGDAAGFGGGDAGDAGGGEGEEGEVGEEAPVSGTRAERYQVVLHVDPQTLAADGEPGRSELEDGTRVSAETSRRLACDAATVRVDRGPDGSVLDVGRRTRTVPPALRRALEVRDRGCRFPGCGLRFTDAHHVEHWADGGETNLGNTLLLCRRHHRLVHEEGWSVEWWGETRAVFTDPRGGRHLDERPPPPDLPDRPVETLVAENRRRGADPGPWEAGVRWQGELDVPGEVLFPAVEAGLEGAASPP